MRLLWFWPYQPQNFARKINHNSDRIQNENLLSPKSQIRKKKIKMAKTDQATAQNAKMNQERKFLSQMLSDSLDGKGQSIKILISEYAKEHKMTCYEVLSQFKDGNQRTALHFACQGNNVDGDSVRVLLGSNWLSNTAKENLLRQKDKDGLTPLMMVAQHPNRDLSYQRTKLLLQIGGNKLALARSQAGATALHYAAGMAASKETLNLLYNAGKICLRTNSKTGGMPLHWIAGTSPKTEKESDFAEALTALIDIYHSSLKNEDSNTNDDTADQTDILNAPNEQGMPPLILAAAANNDKHASILVEKGANWSTILPGNVNLLHMAADLNLIRTLQAILSFQSSNENVAKYLAMQNNQGETPLDLASNEGHVGCVMLLLPNGQNSEEEARDYIQQHQVKQKSNPSIVPTTSSSSPSSDSSLKAFEEQMKVNISKLGDLTITDEQIEQAMKHKQDGNKYFVQKEYADAIEHYTKAISVNPKEPTFYSNRSACYHNLTQYSSALEDALSAKHLKPDWSKAYYRIAVVQLSMEEYEEAACSAWDGLQRDSKNAELKALLQKCVKMGKKDHLEKIDKQKK